MPNDKEPKSYTGYIIGGAALIGLIYLLSRIGAAAEEWKTLACHLGTTPDAWSNWTAGQGSCQINYNNLDAPNKDQFIVPLPNDVPKICGGNAAVYNTPLKMHGFKFMGTYKGANIGTAAGGSGLQVWLAHDITTWTGPEIGILFKFNTGFLTGYVDIGPPINKFWSVNLDIAPDGKEHEYKAEIDSNKHDLIHFYIDGVEVGSIDTKSGINFYDETYRYIASTDNNYGSWNYDDYYLKMRNPQYH